VSKNLKSWLQGLSDSGFIFYIKDGKFKWRAPREGVNFEMVEEIESKNDDIYQLLEQEPDNAIYGNRESVLAEAYRNGYVVIYSPLLKDIYCVHSSTNGYMDAPDDLVSYSVDELKAFKDFTDEEKIKVHESCVEDIPLKKKIKVS